MNWRGASVLVTGGTGSFGRAFVACALAKGPRRVVVFSRDEHKQHEMRREFRDARLAFAVGDVRDPRAVREALHGMSLVVHAAALKQVPVGEAHPMEAVQTNVLGASNVVEAAIEHGVPRILALSSDKAVHPVNVYGATKLLAERIVLQAATRGDRGRTRFSCVRYGNVLGSRGSVVPELKRQRASGSVAVTDPGTTRFWWTIGDAAGFVMRCAGLMKGGEVFVPRMRASLLTDLVKAVVPETPVRVTGRRPGDKVHELLVSRDEAPFTAERDGMFVITPWRTPRGRAFRGEEYSSADAPTFSLAELRAIAR